jgi:hypothetical protein
MGMTEGGRLGKEVFNLLSTLTNRDSGGEMILLSPCMV